MDEVDSLFTRLTQNRVVICKPCGYAVMPQQVESHLSRRHKTIPAQQRKVVSITLQQLPTLAKTKEDIIYPKRTAEPVDGLPVFKDALVCSKCGYICRELKGMMKHCRQTHGWKSEQQRGGNVWKKAKQPTNRIWIDGQTCQQFFVQGPWKRFFQVMQRAEQPEQVQSLVQKGLGMLARRKKEVQELEQRKLIEENDSRYRSSTWLNFTRWPKHLEGFDRLEVIKWTTVPQQDSEPLGEDSIALLEACRAVRTVLKDGISACVNGDFVHALRYISRRETGEENSQKPFYAGFKVATVRKYATVWCRVLCYLWRSYAADKRPAYRLTQRQETCLQNIKDLASREERIALQEACLNLLIALLDQQITDDTFASGLISALAAIGINEQGGGWREPKGYTNVLAAVKSAGRVFVIYKAVRLVETERVELERQGFSKDEAKERAVSVFEHTQVMTDRFMTLTTFGGKPSPMVEVIHCLSYGLGIRRSTPAEGIIQWKGSEISVANISFSMDWLRTMVHGLCETARLKLMSDVLMLDVDEQGRTRKGTTKLPALDLDAVYDNPAESMPGWDFREDTRNACLSSGKSWLLERVLREAKLRRRLVQKPRAGDQQAIDIMWDEVGVAKYMQKLRRFKEELFVLVHFTGGAPARGTEAVSIQFRNSQWSERGVFVDDGLVSLVTSYHKGYSKNQKAKVIHRFVPHEVSLLVVYYLWLVQPFVEALQMCAEGRNEFGDYLWEPEPEETFKDDSDDDEGEIDISEADEEGSSAHGNTNMVEHQERTCHNPDGFWGTDRIRRVISRETQSRMGVRLTTMLWRQLYPAIQREYTRDKGVLETLDDVFDGKRAEEDETAPKQGGHSKQVEQALYGQLLMHFPTYMTEERAKFRRVSSDWHRFLGFPSAWKDEKVDSITKTRIEADQVQQEFQRWKQLRKTNIKAYLQLLVGKDAEFRGPQEPALQAIMHRENPVLVVMGTGGGKSLLFMLPAAASRDGVTVVVVPLNSLRQDLKGRCDTAGISCAEWLGTKPAYWASVVLVTPEAAVGEAFAAFLNEKQAMRQLDRIVIDECHVVLESDSKWRPDMLRLIEMTTKQTQLVFLTATLPPDEQARFCELMGLVEEELVQFRAATVRKNVAYSVHEYESKDEEEEVKKLVTAKKKEYALPGQIIIYCETIEKAKRLAVVLGCQVFHRNVGSEEEKRRILDDLTQGREQVFTSTNALGLGIDAPTIRVVIHVGIRRSMKQYAQESGRAGRDGQKSEAIIMRAFWMGKNGQRRLDPGRKVDEGMKAFMSSEGCRRIPLDEKMDGRIGRLGCEIGEERCDICQGAPRGMKRRRIMVGNMAVRGTSANKEKEEEEEEEEELLLRFEAEKRRDKRMQQRRIEVRQEEGTMLARFEEVFRQWVGVCVICKARGRIRMDHGWRECPIEPEEAMAMERSMRVVGTEFQFEDFSGCRGCGLPFAMCERWMVDERIGAQGRFRLREGKWCQFGKQELHEAVVALCNLGSREVQEWGEAGYEEAWQGSKEADIKEKIRSWLGRRLRWGETESNQMCEILRRWG